MSVQSRLVSKNIPGGCPASACADQDRIDDTVSVCVSSASGGIKVRVENDMESCAGESTDGSGLPGG